MRGENKVGGEVETSAGPSEELAAGAGEEQEEHSHVAGDVSPTQQHSQADRQTAPATEGLCYQQHCHV